MIDFDFDQGPAFRSLGRIRAAALAAVEPRSAVLRALHREGARLSVAGETVALDAVAHIVVLGAGKAAVPMAQAVETVLGAQIAAGLVITKVGHGAPLRFIRQAEAGHPVPTQAGLFAGADLLALATGAQTGDLVIFLISGGGSALLEVLPEGISLVDLQATTDALLASGATIGEINCLRKHLSLVKGGRLAAAAAPARQFTLVLSDVVGSPLDVISSGPTVPDRSTWAEAWNVVQRRGLAARLPGSVLARLAAGLAGEIPETPRVGDPAFARAAALIVGDNAMAAEAARRTAAAEGYAAQVVTTVLEGEAAEVGRALAAQAQAARVQAPCCLIWGGECTVTLGSNPGKGGRNQEVALAAALALEGLRGVTLMALATDGSDGPTDSAGAVVDGSTMARARALGLNPEAALLTHNAYPLLDAIGAHMRTGPTRTNVNDLTVALVE